MKMHRRVFGHKYSRNNKGFSLVEALVAMSVLIICSVPLMQAFMLVSKNNLSGRQILNATMIAENVIENVKAEGVNNYMTEAAGEAAPFSTDWSTPVTINGQDYPVYRQQVNDIVYDGKAYQVKVSFLPSDEQNGTSPGVVYLNGYEECELYAMNAITDAVSVQQTGDIWNIAHEYANGSVGVDTNEIIQKLHTTFEFEVSREAISVAGVASPQYYVVNRKVTYWYPDGADVIEIKVEEDCIYSSRTEIPQNLYIFYIPNAGVGGELLENIIIHNKLTTRTDNLNVYIVRQEEGTPLKLELTEADYHSPRVNLRTNIDITDASTELQVWCNGAGSILSSLKGSMLISELPGEKPVINLYQILVEVMDGKGKKLAELTGTALQ